MENLLTTIVMLAWIPAVLLMFALLPPRRAVLVAFVVAWMFLPVISYRLRMLPDYTKMSATCAGVFFGALIFDGKRILKYSPSWIDLPVLAFCLCSAISSMLNGLGVWDGVSGVLTYTVMWGLPYFIGRIYFTDTKSVQALALSIFIGGLIYIPFCLFEIRMSPQLHEMVYGFKSRPIQLRMGGWRPSVFMDSGLQLGLWMAGATLIGLWMKWTGALNKLHGVSMRWLIWPLLVTTILCRSTSALLTMFMGLGVLWACKVSRRRIVLAGFILIAPVYIGLRATGLWNADQIVSLAKMFSKERAQSFEFRITNENMLVDKALQRPVFGWGGWGRGRVFDEFGRDISITDGRWVIELGAHGWFGVISFFAMMLLPVALLAYEFPVKSLCSKEMAPVAALAILLVLYAIDCIPNSMANPVYMLAAGAVANMALAGSRILETVSAHERALLAGSAVPDYAPLRRLHPGSTW